MSDDLLVSNLFSVKDKIALITGGGTGIGKMIAKAFVKNGAIVYIASRNKTVASRDKASLDDVASELTEMGPGKCFSIEANLDSKDACEKLVTDFKNLGNVKLDILVNNAGTWHESALTDIPEDAWDRIYNLNVKCVFYLTMAFLPLLEKASKKLVDPSRVIITGSILGIGEGELKVMQAVGLCALPYSSSKSAVHSVSKNLAVHLTPRGINVNVLAPGITPITSTPAELDDIKLSDIPQGRVGGELDMAGAALYLASRAGSWISGIELVVDGGTLLQFKLTDVQKISLQSSICAFGLEIARGAKCLIRMEGNQTIITRPTDTNDPGNAKVVKNYFEDVKAFTFDKSYWSFDKNDPNYAIQTHLYNDLGKELLNHAFEGYNTCIFAYGQTGAGKSHTMMGYGEDKGIIPLTCRELFNRIECSKNPNVTYKVQVYFIEIYSERIRDLLNPKNKENLKLREHPALGPYVEDVSNLIVNSFQDIENLIDEGLKLRSVAATNMNVTSSRSHAIFTLLLTQKHYNEATKMDTEKVSRISLVDLAGSERANNAKSAYINKSLTTLGKVIAALAQYSVGSGSKKDWFIPYRDSVLTWLLKDKLGVLGGNCKTTMIAAISPADYDETLSTLRYADAAKRIKCKAIVNEDLNARLIRELKEELPMLRKVYDSSVLDSQQIVTFKDMEGNVIKKTKEELFDQIQASEKLMKEVTETCQEKIMRTEEIQLERGKTLEELGIMIERKKKSAVGVHSPKMVPHIVNLNEDPLLSECLVYQIKSGITRVGRIDSETPSDIRLAGEKILDSHCHFTNENGTVTLHPSPETTTMVNGHRINKPKKLKSGFRIILGDFHVFRFNNPEEVRRERERNNKPSLQINSNTMSEDVIDCVIDWNYARREMAINYLNNTGGPAPAPFPDEDIQRLMDDLRQIRNARKVYFDCLSNNFDNLSDNSDSLSDTSDSLSDNFDNTASEKTEEKVRVIKEKMQRELDLQKQQYEEKIKLLEAEKKLLEEKLKMVQS
ncbi:10351_t:CDS:10 [Racocetra persica]|uniref:10351_t:CDS:1 n=1 Tax=Racocetra persica TaxID=160502 RepID=A0ACA9KPZ4_9GLOM|nr:10351_t:CDS:10 [Racocetra persica]